MSETRDRTQRPAGARMMWKSFAVAGAVGLLALAPAAAPAAVLALPASKDAMIFGTSANADTNNASGRGPAMFAGADGSSNKKRSLIQFDVAGNLPAGAHVNSATLTLYLAQIAGSGGGGTGGSIPSRTFNLYDLRQDWGEGTSGSPTTAGVGGSGQGYARVTGDSSWDYAVYNSADTAAGKWTFGGTNLQGGNFAAAASASSTFTTFTVNAPYSWSSAGLAADVQSWLDAPSGNHGLLLKSETGLDTSGNTVVLENMPTSFLGFWTRDGAAANSNPAIAPVLTIDYTVPEPAAVGLLTAAIGGLLLARRRRSSKRSENA